METAWNGRLGTDVVAERERRADLVTEMTPQYGIDDLKGAFPNADPEPPEGVENKS